MLQASDLTKAHDGAPLFDGLSFVLADGERAGLCGPNGVGKSTLVRLLAGVDRADRGAVAVGRGDRIGWLAQEAPDAAATLGELLGAGVGEAWRARGELRALEARLAAGDASAETLVAYGRVQERFDALGGWALEASLDAARRALSIDHVDLATPLARMSGGEQARALLAGTLLGRPTVLLLDEPTNHLDGDGLSWLERTLAAFAGTVVVVSHDRAFLDATVGCILELAPGGALTRYEGGYSAYRAERERRRERQALAYEAQEKRRRRLEAKAASVRSSQDRPSPSRWLVGSSSSSTVGRPSSVPASSARACSPPTSAPAASRGRRGRSTARAGPVERGLQGPASERVEALLHRPYAASVSADASPAARRASSTRSSPRARHASPRPAPSSSPSVAAASGASCGSQPMRSPRPTAAAPRSAIDAGQHAHQRRLADAVGPAQAGTLAVGEHEREPVEQRRAVVGLGQIGCLQHGVLPSDGPGTRSRQQAGRAGAGAPAVQPRHRTPEPTRDRPRRPVVVCGGCLLHRGAASRPGARPVVRLPRRRSPTPG